MILRLRDVTVGCTRGVIVQSWPRDARSRTTPRIKSRGSIFLNSALELRGARRSRLARPQICASREAWIDRQEITELGAERASTPLRSLGPTRVRAGANEAFRSDVTVWSRSANVRYRPRKIITRSPGPARGSYLLHVDCATGRPCKRRHYQVVR